MKKYLAVMVLVVCVAGCTWEQTERNADKVTAGANKAADINGALAPVTGPWGAAAGGILLGIAGIARSVSALAKARRLAKAAVAAAEMVDKGGSAISTAAVLHGAQDEITAAYEDGLKSGLIKPKG